MIVEAKRIRRISIRREPISIYIGIISRDENSAADRLPRPLEVRSRTRGKKGRVTGTSKTNSTLLDTPRNRPPNFLPSILPSFLPSVLPLSRPWNVVTRALRGENFCTHVFRVSHRCFIKPGPSGEGSSDLESTPARAQVSGDTRGMGEGSECRVGVARHSRFRFRSWKPSLRRSSTSGSSYRYVQQLESSVSNRCYRPLTHAPN